jgi:hypothetical protein
MSERNFEIETGTAGRTNGGADRSPNHFLACFATADPLRSADR